MVSHTVRVVRETTKTQTVELAGHEILDMLRRHGIGIPEGVPVEVFVCVPGGGDYSNTSLDVDEDCPVTVRWKTQETEVDDGRT